LVANQPAVGELASPGDSAGYSYTLPEARLVTLRAFGEVLRPTITILRDDEVIASEPNAAGDLIVSLEPVLSAGEYEVVVGSVNVTSGVFILLVERETPIEITMLSPGSKAIGEVGAGQLLAVYLF